MRIRYAFALTAAITLAACGDAGPVASTDDPASTPSTAATTIAPSTLAPPTSQRPTSPETAPTQIDTYRDEYVVATERGEIVVTGEHTADASRWVQMFGSEDGFAIETVVIGNDQWERLDAGAWTAVDSSSVDDAFPHPITVEEVTRTFTAVGPSTHEGLSVSVYQLEGPAVADHVGPGLEFESGTITASVFPTGAFASYEFLINESSEAWIRVTYRIYDVGEPIVVERPEVVAEVLTCRDPYTQLIEEVGSYRSRYDLLHPGAVFSSIEELRLLDPWAWQQTVRFRDSDAFIDTLWVNGGFQYWREPGGPWQDDLDGTYQSMAYRPFVDDLWLPDLVAMFDPVGTDSVNGRNVDVFELGLDDVARLNDGLVRETDTLEATFWVEPCSSPALLKAEVVATGRRFVDGAFHIIYEVYDLGTPASIDIPAEALDD